MASISPLKELINNTSLGDMHKLLIKDPFPNITIGMFNKNDRKILNFYI